MFSFALSKKVTEEADGNHQTRDDFWHTFFDVEIMKHELPADWRPGDGIS